MKFNLVLNLFAWEVYTHKYEKKLTKASGFVDTMRFAKLVLYHLFFIFVF